MYNVEIIIGKIDNLNSKDYELLKEKINDLIEFMVFSNQIFDGSHIVFEERSLFRIMALSYEINFIDFSCIELMNLIKLIRDEFNAEIKVNNLGINRFYEKVEIQKDAKNYILYPGLYSIVRDFENINPIPFYRIIDQYFSRKSFDDLRFWARDYFAIMSLWNRGSVKEKAQLYQLSNIKSELNTKGLSVRSRLEIQTKKKCYYYLFTIPGNNRKDACPICQGKWKQKKILLNNFNFLCHKCRLIS